MARLTAIGAALSLAVCAGALVLPESAAGQRPLLGSHADSTASGDGSSRWPSSLPWKDAIDIDEAEHAVQVFAEDVDAAVDSVAHAVEAVRGRIHDEFSKAIASIAADSKPKYPGHPKHPDHSDFTIYQLISHNKYTTKFAKIVNEYPSIVHLLNSTSANYTLFVPVDEAFEDIPDDHGDPGKEFIEDLLHYHVGLGNYPARKLFKSYTVPTAFDEKYLGGEPQRLRVSLGLHGLKLNFYSKVVAADIAAKNGYIHAVNHILVPPPLVGRIITLFPGYFSTLLLAYEKTDFVKFVHGIKMVGSTVFVPTNKAFAWLGPKANAFLFNTEQGLKYLNAILKYHIVPNATLYTDAFYDKRGGSSDVGESRSEHYNLPTLLGKAHLGVDIGRLWSFATIKVNGFTQVTVANGIARNGVIQVVDRVLIPPHKHHKDSASAEVDEIEVEDLKSRLNEYL